jgi:hypothetical protein
MTTLSSEIIILLEQTRPFNEAVGTDLIATLEGAVLSARNAAEEMQSGEPSLALEGLRQTEHALSNFTEAVVDYPSDSAKHLIAEGNRLRRRTEKLISSYEHRLVTLIGDVLLGVDNSFYFRKVSDTSAFGPPVVDREDLKVFLKVRRRKSSVDDPIDDLTATCGIWLCNPFGDSCICAEWDCDGDGHSGSFP